MEFRIADLCQKRFLKVDALCSSLPDSEIEKIQSVDSECTADILNTNDIDLEKGNN